MKQIAKSARFVLLVQSLAYFGLGFVSIFPAYGASEKFDSADDHLIPVEYRFDQSYQALVSSRLFVGRANLRIVTLPSHATEGETVVALCSHCQETAETRVTVTRAERSLWSAKFGQDPKFTHGPAPKVRRCDAAIPNSLAEVIFKAVKKMVDETRALRNRENVVVLDSTDTVFSIEGSDGRRSQGLLTPYAAGKNGAAMRRLTDFLMKYCESQPSLRPPFLKKIKTEAHNLTP
ncbi:MAG: hypothetical protein QOK24_710 [Verrucomicrobiota bacterium]|jgi:hypothetical protein